jgi:hypothetical protein
MKNVPTLVHAFSATCLVCGLLSWINCDNFSKPCYLLNCIVRVTVAQMDFSTSCIVEKSVAVAPLPSEVVVNITTTTITPRVVVDYSTICVLASPPAVTEAATKPTSVLFCFCKNIRTISHGGISPRISLGSCFLRKAETEKQEERSYLFHNKKKLEAFYNQAAVYSQKIAILTSAIFWVKVVGVLTSSNLIGGCFHNLLITKDKYFYATV